ncbi:hypothetical protein GE061_017389 [Apolygus lucorum]|uniref:UDP-glycosyltransferases domain-containing protein n=1 Tax=Apolygus lucorum TaxID=248454 RepID=A0A8S9XCA7_APOLU|nr:hypothetical protein GE061_017389 [Apolygus lucorum]
MRKKWKFLYAGSHRIGLFIASTARSPGFSCLLEDEAILDLVELYNSVEVTAPNIDFVYLRKEAQIQPQACLLGDSGYGISPWLITPIRRPQTGFEIQYNVLHTKERVIIERVFGQLVERGQMNMHDMMNMATFGQTFLIGEMSLYVARKLFEEEPLVTKLINSNEKYDMVILENYFSQEYASALCHKFKAPCVSMVGLLDSTWINEMSGLPDNPSYMVDFKAETTDKMTFIERLKNVYIWTSTMLLSYYYALGPQQEVADKYIRYPGWESRPSVLQLSRDMDLILINSHVSLGYPYPKAPHVKEVGGMNLAPNKPLPKDLQDFMDSATDGVIYFSYGSNVDMNELTRDGKFDDFVNVFKKLKQKVLWKWKGSKIPKVDAPNVKIQEWFPQQDILAHKNTKIFMTHGGLMSLIESIYHGVPLIGTAVFGDQPKNLKVVEHTGIGLQLKFDNLTEKSISWAVNEILNNPSYKNNMKKRSELFNDRPMKPVDEGVYWIEYVLRHGKVLQPASALMPFYQVYLLDVLGAVALSVLLAMWLIRRNDKCRLLVVLREKQE